MREGSAGVGGVSARLAISTGLTAVRKTVGEEGFAGAATASAGGEGAPPTQTVRGKGAGVIQVAGEKQSAARYQSVACISEDALAYARGGMRSSSGAGRTQMI